MLEDRGDRSVQFIVWHERKCGSAGSRRLPRQHHGAMRIGRRRHSRAMLSKRLRDRTFRSRAAGLTIDIEQVRKPAAPRPSQQRHLDLRFQHSFEHRFRTREQALSVVLGKHGSKQSCSGACHGANENRKGSATDRNSLPLSLHDAIDRHGHAIFFVMSSQTIRDRDDLGT